MQKGRIISPIVKVYMEGWESDTYTLQKHGWDLHIAEDYREGYTLGCTNDRLGLILMSKPLDMRLYRNYEICSSEKPPFVINHIINRQTTILMQNTDLNNFKSFDATPMYMDMGTSYTYEDYMKMFNTSDIKTKHDIIVAPDEVNYWLEKIHEAQKPEQRDRIKNRRSDDIPTMEARILSFAA